MLGEMLEKCFTMSTIKHVTRRMSFTPTTPLKTKVILHLQGFYSEINTIATFSLRLHTRSNMHCEDVSVNVRRMEVLIYDMFPGCFA